MSALVNGTYTISSVLGGGNQFYLGLSSAVMGGPLVIDSFTDSESGRVRGIDLLTKRQSLNSSVTQWDVESSNISNAYTFRNRRYQTYISSNTPPQSLESLVGAKDPRNWYVTPADSGYV